MSDDTLASKKSTATDINRNCPYVGVLSMHPAPYRDPLFDEVHRRGKLNIQVLTLFSRDTNHGFWDLDHTIYPNISAGRAYRIGISRYIHPGIIRLLRRHRFDVIVISSIHPTMKLALLFCWATGTPYVYSSDGVFNEGLCSLGRRLRSFRDRFVALRARALFVPGGAARAYVECLGVPASRIFEGCYQLDSDKIVSSFEMMNHQRDRLREEQGISRHCFVFLMVANMTPNRRHRLLIDAFSRVAARSDCCLLLIGEGPQRRHLEDICNRYAISDAYVHSGSEPYSTAVAYAATVGLPVISSKAVGAAQDYIEDGVTGYLCDPSDVDAYARNMLQLSQDTERAKSMGRQARKRALVRDPKWAAEQFESAVASAVTP
jgi:glycosyltransferase involved in cell wall biosynthesis